MSKPLFFITIVLKYVFCTDTCEKYTFLVNDEQVFAKNIELICKTSIFSNISFRIDQPCKNIDLLGKCGLFNCLFESNQKLDVSQQANGVITVDLLRNPPSYTNYSRNSKIIWKKLTEISSIPVYSFLLEAIKQSIDIYICRNYKRINIKDYSNSMILKIISRTPFISDIYQLFKRSNIYKYLNVPYHSNLRLFRLKFDKRNIKELRQLKYMLIFAICHTQQAGSQDITQFILFDGIEKKTSRKEKRSIHNSSVTKEHYKQNLITYSDMTSNENERNEIVYTKKGHTMDNLNVLINNPILDHLLRDLSDIQSILNCITCEKCRLWAIIQFNGLIATLKTLQNKSITADEYIYLLNMLNKLIQGEKEYNMMIDMCKYYNWYMLLFYSKEIFSVIIGIAITYCLFIKDR